jgi:rhodanese-related sulfurtransferase/DNA-binding transcriptional ArsR family regulator
VAEFLRKVDWMGDMSHKTALFEQLARVGKALANGKRLELLDLLAQAERSVETLAAAAHLNLTTASAHLQTLKSAGLVATRRDGTRIHYRLAGDDVAELLVMARAVASSRLPDVRASHERYLGRAAGVEQIGRDELLRRIERGQVTVLDLRPADEYAAGHLPDAINIPIDELAGRVAELPDGADVVAYCRGPYCVFAHDAVRLLRADGRPAFRLDDGVLEWRLAGLPIAA